MGTAQVLPGILQKHCCILPDRNTEEDGGDLVQPGIGFPGPADEDLGRAPETPSPAIAQATRRGFLHA
uniref:DLG associated protein 2 n=1 Tax=Rousettus aegyptiacus TaxID=9407 RepID=A0A7J8DWK1_ROUAE|nr:DLG associated protein 2 [Rousettus aegyptiacus]